jgi:hypothetical protein
MQNSAARQTPPAKSASGNQAASVPISVYRQLSAELQTAKAMLDTINGRNKTLTHENQVLRQELERVVRVAISANQVLGLPSEEVPTPPQNQAEKLADHIRTVAQPPDEPTVISNELFTEEGMVVDHTTESSPHEVSGLWKTLLIVAIIITAFGAGFAVVRQVMPRR